jgi:hypothetical protein
MKKITGADFAKAIEQFTEQQTAKAQEAYSFRIASLIGPFTLKYSVPVQTGAVSAISRLIKRIDEDSVRQIRAMSEPLLRVDELSLRSELEEIQSQLLPLGAQTHQVKTRAAFINTVIRPFDSKYATRWLAERKDLNIDSARERIQDLEARVLAAPKDLHRWADDVMSLFNDLVIYWGEEADQYYLRPAGTISPKSSRTYVQAWVAFIEKFGDQILDLAVTGTSDQMVGTYYSMGPPDDWEPSFNQSAPPADREIGLGQSVPEKVFASLSEPIASDEVIMSYELNSPSRSRPPRVSSPRAKSSWIKVDLTSVIEPTAQASRKWDSRTSFYESLDSWISSLEEIWGSASLELTAKILVKTSDGESDLTIPTLSIDDAEKRISQTVELLQRS